MSITAPRGFRASGIAAGIKASGGKDFAVVANDAHPALRAAAAVFTSNRFQAAPVQWSRQAMAAGTPAAIVLNSGGANACTGPQGLRDAESTAAGAARRLGLEPHEVLVCSTGLIGQALPMDKVLAGIGIGVEGLSRSGGPDAAEAIQTTDTVPKKAIVAGQDGAYSIGGMAKGAGMLAPELATMLVVLTTDAVIGSPELGVALAEAVRLTFDRVDSDGCQSTNDSVIVLASGASGHTPDLEGFTIALTDACGSLARQLLADAEGASHDIAVNVTGAASEAAALAVARAVSRSNLVKTAIFGNDPNWGRILSAAGTVPAAAAPYDPDSVDVTINGVTVARSGGIGEDRSAVDLTGREVVIDIDLDAGPACATIWTNDLTKDYVHENSAYSS